jgi:hypothetical protein
MSKPKIIDTRDKNEWNFSAVMNQSRVSTKMEKTFVSPKARMSHCRSPRQSAMKQDPLKIVTEFERNFLQSILNLSNCGLDDEALQYFIQKALGNHVPFEINISKNRLSLSGFVKLLPHFLKVSTVNVAYTGLSDGCLDHLLKIKGNRRL